jgi:hypothetical protein
VGHGTKNRRARMVGWVAKEKIFIKGEVLFQKAVTTVTTVTKVKNGLKMLKRGRKMVKKTQETVI